ncbi:DUF3365 domain-containing protein [Desulfuromonas sp. AOP6]|uniref:c-type heme family protein n=1 Tax=Desulfuromonas sp. AOP6 TaxID=1566351 RepID=UPI001276EFDE|nr:DUF3365 domain-containing protein [Desulfuromonas sp. AOP6]BCA80682.1 hypothetical protein AOP6_2469 [Desulfuromonas sp. AOP6]
MRLRTRLTWAMLVIFAVSLLLVEVLRYHGVDWEVREVKLNEARALHSMVMATRQVYHHQFIDSGLPLTDETLGFLPAHALLRISKDFSTRNPSGISFNNVSENPRNADNLADDMERQAIAYFREKPAETERLHVYRAESDQTIYHYATPIRTETYCLTCHGQNATAPASIRARYDAGYDYGVGQLVGIFSIKMPGTSVKTMTNRLFWMNFVDHLIGYLILFLALITLLSVFILNRLRPLRQAALAVAAGDYRIAVPEGPEDEIGEVSTAFKAMATTIEEREKALRESEQQKRELSDQLKTLLDGIPDVLHLLDRNFKIVWANKSSAAYIDVSPEEMVGKICHYMTDNPCLNCPARITFATGEAAEEVISTPDGRIWGVKTFPLKDENGTVRQVIELASDITEKLKLREEANQSSRLAALGELTAGVAHEINNPNALILLNLPLLQDVFSESLPILDAHFRDAPDGEFAGFPYRRMREEIPLVLDEVQGGARRIKRIVEDLKEFVRREHSDRHENFFLHEAVQAALRLVANPIHKATDHFSTHYATDLPPLHGNMQRIEQVIINLVVNACQALPDRNRAISIRTSFDAAAAEVVFEVSDQGVGIAPENLPRLTESFFTTRREEGGTGLGLSVSSRIVREHGGTLSFESTPGVGTRAILRLPVAPEE